MTNSPHTDSSLLSFPVFQRTNSDPEFLQQDQLRAVRLQLDCFKPELIGHDENLVPIGRTSEQDLINLKKLVECRLIRHIDLHVVLYAETVGESWKIIVAEHQTEAPS